MTAETGADLLRDLPMLMPGGIPSNVYEVHERLYEMFCVGGRRAFLFAMERDRAPIVLIRSRSLPDGIAASAIPVETPPAGERRLFRLEASPVVSDNGKKCRLPVGDMSARIGWLAKRAEGCGFGLVGEPSVRWRTVRMIRKGVRIARESALFEGELEVTDAERLGHALEHGIGRSHAFGFGLLRLFLPN